VQLQPEKQKKILLLGLDFAGKTSILKVLTQKFSNIKSIENIKPTTMIERNIITVMGIQIAIWDLGGQEKYRNEYLSDIRTFAETNSIFFVLDMSHPERFELALQYFLSSLIIIESLGLQPKIVLCLHKMDPTIINDAKTKELEKKATTLFQNNARGRQISVFNTSIYDVKSIVRAFSPTLQELVKTLKPFRKILESLVFQLKLEGIILFDETLMILGEFYNNKACEEMCLNSVYNSVIKLRSSDPQLQEENFPHSFEALLNQEAKEPRFRFLRIKIKDWNSYILTIGKEKIDEKAITTIFNEIPS
jgi:Ras-related GTP-binding protein A/B